MNRPPKEYKRIPAAQLRRFAEECFAAAGLRSDHAAQLAELLTNSDLRGVHSHGTGSVYGYCRGLREGYFNPTPELREAARTGNAVLIDGDGGLGYAPTMAATEAAIAMAKERGVGVGGGCCLGHFGAAAHYVRRAMQEGCVALAVQGAYPQYYEDNQGRPAAYYGNPPLCLGLPGDEEPPLVLDGGTCILADYQRGEQFDALQELIPAAFFKSMGYTGVASALGGVFVGQSTERARQVAQRWRAARHGALVLVVDAGLFVPLDELRRGMDELVRGVRQDMQPVRGHEEAALPGTLEHRREREYLRDGIPMDLRTLKHLERAGIELGVAVPWS